MVTITVNGLYADIDDTMIIDGDLLFFNSGKDSCIKRNVLLTLISKILSHTASDVSKSVDALGYVAAFDTRISKPSNSFSVYNIYEYEIFLYIESNFKHRTAYKI